MIPHLPFFRRQHFLFVAENLVNRMLIAHQLFPSGFQMGRFGLAVFQ
jgi:hypothetical protein